MRTLEQETSVEVLKLFSKWLMDENIELKKKFENEKAKRDQEAQLRLKYEDQLMVFRRLIFGKKSEKSGTRTRERDREEEELLLHSQSLIPSPKERNHRDLPEEVVYHFMSPEALKEEAEVRGFQNTTVADWEKMEGFFEESIEITLVERSYKKIRHKRQKYRFSGPNQVDKQIIVTASGAEKLIPGGSYSIDFACSVVADKYLYHLPLERQCRQMEALGLKGLAPKTLYNLCLFTSVYLEPVAEKIKKSILESNLAVHCDETPWPINTSKQDDGYLWVISNQAGSFYRFEPTRAGETVANMLGDDFKGALLTDGYVGYNRFKNNDHIVVGNCWAHARRKFFEIKENYPECDEVLKLMEELFGIERRAKNFEELKILREKESKVVAKKIYEWLLTTQAKARPQGKLSDGIMYCLRRWTELTNFLKDTRLPLTNNDVERAMRQAVMGRKNFHGSRTHNGADVAATIYTIVESCKKVELDPREYINMVIRTQIRGGSPPTPLEYAHQIRFSKEKPPASTTH